MSYITTHSKIHFTPQSPNKDDIDIGDIAHALSYMCRANGHFKSFYSVAQHSINCSMEAKARGRSRDVQLACLLHDASEAYISDITRPVKKLLPQYLVIEERLQCLIYEKFNISEIDLEMVKEIDDALLYYEFLYLHGEKVLDHEPKLVSHPDISQCDFISVKNQFIDLYHQLSSDVRLFKTIGIDGCKGGWMVAMLSGNRISFERHESIADALYVYKTADRFIIDIPIGLADCKEEALDRPDNAARKILKGKASSLFPAPFRSVTRAKTASEAWDISKKNHAGTSYMTMGIRNAVNEIDVFLQENAEWKNVLCESHPEVCFTLLNKGNPILEKKSDKQGIERRLEVLQKFGINKASLTEHPLFNKYSDDIVDAACLALVGKLQSEGKSATIPCENKIKSDRTGLKMQMIIPKL